MVEPTSEQPPEKDTDFHPMEWMIRPCEIYNEEYKDCKSIRARFHQYFVFGEYIDCSQWKIDYNNCYIWEKYKNKAACNALIESEQQRRIQRLKGHYANDVWEKRDKPPDNWNTPLPQWMEKDLEKSVLAYKVKKLKAGQLEKGTSCTIL